MVFLRKENNREEPKMSKYTTDMTRLELDLVRATLVSHGITATLAAAVWGDPEAPILTVALNEAALDCLSNLPEEADWHCSDGQLYADGAVYPLTVVHNA
jgi:hypothetical protein